jgi:hypothetical protein
VNKEIGARILQGCGGTHNDEHKLKHILFVWQLGSNLSIPSPESRDFIFLLHNLTHAPRKIGVSLNFPNAKHFHPQKLKTSGIRNKI